MVVLTVFGGVFQLWLDRGKAVFATPESGEDSCVVLVMDGKAAVLSLGGYRTSAVQEIFQRHNVTQVETVCMPVSTSDAREAAVQVLGKLRRAADPARGRFGRPGSGGGFERRGAGVPFRWRKL